MFIEDACTWRLLFSEVSFGIMDSSDEDMMLLDGVLPKLFFLNRRIRSSNAHDINKRREDVGEYHHLFKQLKNHPDRFFFLT